LSGLGWAMRRNGTKQTTRIELLVGLLETTIIITAATATAITPTASTPLIRLGTDQAVVGDQTVMDEEAVAKAVEKAVVEEAVAKAGET
jgi:hypothetical protein